VKEDDRNEAIDVSREAIATLAAQAACEIDGVESCQQKTADTITSRVKREYLYKGVKVEGGEDDSYRLVLYLRVRYGVHLPSLARELREKVKEYIEGLTEVDVEDVEIVIEDIEA
jgi:uncharacterized alkaline shock family protein YloU